MRIRTSFLSLLTLLAGPAGHLLQASMPTLVPSVDGSEIVLTWEASALNPGSATELYYGFQLEESSDLLTWTDRGGVIPCRIGGGTVVHEARIALESVSTYFRLRFMLDLSGQDLGGSDLSGLDFGEANLEGTDLSGADLGGASLLDASYENIAIDSLGGPASRPVRESIPEMLFADGGAGFSADAAMLDGVEISHNTLLLAFKPDTTTAEANAILAAIGATIVGGIPSEDPDTPAILVIQFPAANHIELGVAIAALQAEEEVESLARNVMLGLDAVPNDDFFEWGEWPWTPGMDPPLGNWGLRAAKIPQMWNFNTKIRQMIRAGERPELIDVAVLDAGFDPTIDFNRLQRVGTVTTGSHGQHVIGIIGSQFSFWDTPSLSIDGVNPFARLHIADVDGNLAPTEDAEGGDEDDSNLISFADLLLTLNKVVSRVPNASALNLSLGYGWHKRRDDRSTVDVVEDSSRNPMLDLEVQELVRSESGFRSLLWRIKSAAGFGPLLVTSAGNSSNFFDRNAVMGAVSARWNSPWNYAALVDDDTDVIVVEATRNEACDYYSHSCLGGHVKAPGQWIFSTVWPNQRNGFVTQKRLTGTSMAAPHVTGVVSYMRMIEPSLTNAQVRQILTRFEGSFQMGAPLNGFAAVMDIDRVTGGTEVLKMLVDVDDGSADGNERVRRLASTEDTGPSDLAAEPSEFPVNDQAGEIEGDGRVDISDFRRWRDWLLQDQNGADSSTIDLDGAVDHYKKDLNADGTVEDMMRENMFPRGDFNGDGQIDRGSFAFVPGAFHGDSTDLGILREIYQEDEFWSKNDLENLLDSFELHISLYEIHRHNWENPDEKINEVTIEFSSGDPGFKKGAYPVHIPVPDLAENDPTARFFQLTLTLPTPPTRYRPIIYGKREGTPFEDDPDILGEPRVDAKPGTDFYFVPKYRIDF